MNKKQGRVILVGIDGGNWELINRFLEKHSLRAFDFLKENGAFGVLKSTIPCFSPLAWNSIFTGVNPGKHKIFGFVQHQFHSVDLKPLSSSDREYPALWNYTGYFNVDSTFVNIPFSYPLDVNNGVFVSGLGVPSLNSEFTFPPDLKSRIRKNYPEYSIDFDQKLGLERKNKKQFVLGCLKVLESKINLSKELFCNKSWKCFVTVFRATDVVQHFCWDDEDALLKIYQAIDDFLSFVIKNMKKSDTLIIVSDHGFSKLKGMVHLVNWLIGEQFMRLRSSFRPKSDFLWKLQDIAKKLGLEDLLRVYKENRVFRHLAFKILPPKRYSYLSQVDWKNSKLSYDEDSVGSASFNPDLKRNSQELASFFNYLRTRTSDLTDEEGNKVFKGIYLGKDLYKGKGKIPDIIFRVNPGYCIDGYVPGNSYVSRFAKNATVGVHGENGILLLLGDDICKGKQIESSSVCDILPTILYLLGINIPEYLDGEPVKNAFVGDTHYQISHFDKNKFMDVQGIKTRYSREEEEVIKKRLKSLGYL